MDPSPTPLILTKLRPPALRSNAVPRTRLLQRIVLEAGTDLVLVSAPAGYGKTTLLVEWAGQLAQSGVKVAWYGLDERDNSPIVFGSYLLDGLHRLLGPEYGLESTLQGIRSSPGANLLNILPTVINAILAKGQKTVLILDDYHLVHEPTIHQAVEFLLNHRSENLHLAIGSRCNPPLPLARLRAKGNLVELHAAELRFREDETERFFRDSMGLEVPPELIGQLWVRVDGWAAGLQLAGLSLASHADPQNILPMITGGHKRLVEYLLDEVINRLPEVTQSFLLWTSILERLSAPLCDAVLGIDHSAQVLSQLEEANLFITALDDEGTWYRYHPLFRDFLRTWLAKTQPEQTAALHRAASSWFAGRGSLYEAADHAFQSGDWGFAADLVEQFSFTLIIRSEIATIYEWCSAFPETVMLERPKLCVFQALALAYQFHRKDRSRVEARLEQAEGKLADLRDAQQSNEVNDLAAVARTFLAMAPDPGVDMQELLTQAESRLGSYPEGDPEMFTWLLLAGYSLQALHRIEEAEKAFQDALPFARQSGLFFGVVETTFHLARLARSRGRLAEVLRICQEGQETLAAAMQGANLELPALGCLDIAIGDVLLEQNHLDEAERHLRLGMKRMGGGMNPYYLQFGWLVKFRLIQAQGRLDEALSCLDQLDLLWPDLQFLTGGLRAQAALRFHLDKEAAASAKDWLESYLTCVGGVLPLPGLGPIGGAELFYQANLVWAQLQIAVGDPEKEGPLLTRWLELARESDLSGREMELNLIEAQMHHKMGDERLALASLERALAAGQPEGFIRIFDQGIILNDLIHQAVRQGTSPSYCDRILAAIRSSPEGRLASGVGGTGQNSTSLSKTLFNGPLLDALTERELDVLRLMAAGATNQGIAERLVITVGTVKSHINHILAKLGACNRTEAVALARKHGLLVG